MTTDCLCCADLATTVMMTSHAASSESNTLQSNASPVAPPRTGTTRELSLSLPLPSPMPTRATTSAFMPSPFFTHPAHIAVGTSIFYAATDATDVEMDAEDGAYPSPVLHGVV